MKSTFIFSSSAGFLLSLAAAKIGVSTLLKLLPESIKRWKELGSEQQHLFRNRFASLVHSVCCCLILARSLYLGELLGLGTADLVFSEVNDASIIFPFSWGYFLFDSLSLFLEIYRTRNWADAVFLPHHIVILAGIPVALSSRMCQPFLLLMLLAEPHSVFLHLRKCMQLLGPPAKRGTPRPEPSVAYKWVVLANVVTCVLCRLLGHAWAVNLTVLTLHRLPVTLAALGLLGASITYISNVGLAWRLFLAERHLIFGRNRRRAA
eukprot:TRINITY_DN25650_c0_g1_i1.p1 TRINITY_DN25650_c0_g1~~TRINITY_DN25650_c0_g1_i1.p1  ORF type:complete len:264 (-),score=20.49 TRINITY_DN25650_c0_g1_i1:55-846(-)